jgi:hypothetical protein
MADNRPILEMFLAGDEVKIPEGSMVAITSIGELGHEGAWIGS